MTRTLTTQSSVSVSAQIASAPIAVAHPRPRTLPDQTLSEISSAPAREFRAACDARFARARRTRAAPGRSIGAMPNIGT